MSEAIPFLVVSVICALAFLIVIVFNRADRRRNIELDQRILAALRDEPGISAYRLTSKLNIGHQIYPTLMRLENEGRILSDWKEGAYPRQRVYWAAKP